MAPSRPDPSAESKVEEGVSRALASARELSALGAFWALDERAPEAGARVEAGAPLAGMPVAVKDLLDQRGLPTTAGLRSGAAPAAADAELVRRLRRAGAVPIGKTAMDPLGCTTGGQAPGFPPCVNPRGAGLSPGGSSSGSAVAVAAGIVPVALGTDTAGSVRIPAAYCGVVGFKPWRRSLPRRGITRVMPGFDTPGLLAESVALVVRAYAALTGRTIAEPAATLRVGVLGDVLERADPVVAGAVEGTLGRLADGRIVLETVELSWEPKGFGEALAFELAQVWGARVTREPERFNEVIRASVAFGQTVGERRYRDAIASFAAARTRLRRRLGRFDALLTPTVPVPAPKRDDEDVATSTAFTRVFNALDWPAISVPVPGGGARPVALQVAGPPTRLDQVFATAAEIEAAG